MLEIIGAVSAVVIALAIIGKFFIGSIQDLRITVTQHEENIQSLEKNINGGFKRNDTDHKAILDSLKELRDKIA